MNINLVKNPTPKENIPADYEDVLLNQIQTIPASICANISINHTLNYLTNDQLISLLGKIRHGGIISISSFDAMEIARALYWGEIDIQNLDLINLTWLLRLEIYHHLYSLKSKP